MQFEVKRKWDIFRFLSDPLFIAFLGPKQILDFLFLMKNNLTYVSSRKFSRPVSDRKF